MARFPLSRKRKTKAQVALFTARRTLKATPKAAKAARKTVVLAPQALKVRIAGGLAALAALLMVVRRARRRRQDDGLGLYEPPPAAARGGVSPPPDPAARRPKEAPGDTPEAVADSSAETPAGAIDPPLGPVPGTEK